MSNLSCISVESGERGINRTRPEGFAVTETNAGFANVLFKIVQRIDAGEPASDWGCWVQEIGRSMGRSR